MERLTFEGNFCDIALCLETPGGSFCEEGPCTQRKVWERLKLYEDTGLTPEICANYKMFEDEAISKNVTFTRIVELMNAEAEGRLTVLPFKRGATVYVAGERRIIECYIDEVYINDDVHGIEYLVSFNCDSDCEGCPFNSWHQDYSGEYSCNGEWGQASIMGSESGKTVFLTHDAALAAMKGGKT